LPSKSFNKVRHKWIGFISVAGCLRPFLPFKELKRLQIEALPFKDPVATLLRSVLGDGPQGRGYNDWGAVK
jgi:hypothetical protein